MGAGTTTDTRGYTHAVAYLSLHVVLTLFLVWCSFVLTKPIDRHVSGAFTSQLVPMMDCFSIILYAKACPHPVLCAILTLFVQSGRPFYGHVSKVGEDVGIFLEGSVESRHSCFRPDELS